MTAEYEPWETLIEVEVTVPHALERYGINTRKVKLPWIAGRDAQAVLRTGVYLADNALKAMRAALDMRDEAAAQKAEEQRFSTLRFEPPLVRFRCPICEQEKDGWVSDDGALQDRRDAFCGNPVCPERGRLLQVVKEEDE